MRIIAVIRSKMDQIGNRYDRIILAEHHAASDHVLIPFNDRISASFRLGLSLLHGSADRARARGTKISPY
jgi:hypothetical protein